LDRLRRAAARQTELDALSKQFARRLDVDAFYARNLDAEYARVTSVRPYVITAESPAEAARAVTALWSLDSAEQKREFFSQQIAAFDPQLLRDARDEVPDDSTAWRIIEEDLRRLHGLRSAALHDTPYVVPVAKQEPFEGDDSVTVLSEDTETIVLRGRQVTEAYGNLLATTLARFAAMCRPTWWLGRNFWLGLLAVAHLPLRQRLFNSPVRHMQAQLRSRVATPAQLLEPLAIEGFDAGMSISCEAFSAGLYLSHAAVTDLLSDVQRDRAVFVDLAAAISPYEKSVVAGLVDVVEEALLWAAETGHGFIEGDELVGYQGYR
jgi:hypothetical protein